MQARRFFAIFRFAPEVRAFLAECFFLQFLIAFLRAALASLLLSP